jgi:hypothetical protein
VDEWSVFALQAQLLGNGLLIGATGLAIAVVWRITKRQDEKYYRILAS